MVNWVVDYIDNSQTREPDLVEYYSGKVDRQMNKLTLDLWYRIKVRTWLIFEKVKQNIIGVRQIINKLNGLNLQNYYFECEVLLMNVILRGAFYVHLRSIMILRKIS